VNFRAPSIPPKSKNLKDYKNTNPILHQAEKKDEEFVKEEQALHVTRPTSTCRQLLSTACIRTSCLRGVRKFMMIATLCASGKDVAFFVQMSIKRRVLPH
jgi:hypothetical protein